MFITFFSLRLSDCAQQRKVRALFKSLLGRNELAPDNLMSREETKAFAVIWTNTKTAICCDIRNFKIDLLGTPRSAWNQSASRVFADYFIQVHGDDYTRATIQFSFFKRVRSVSSLQITILSSYEQVRSLQLAFKKSLMSPSVLAEEEVTQKRLGRMRSVCNIHSTFQSVLIII